MKNPDLGVKHLAWQHCT